MITRRSFIAGSTAAAGLVLGATGAHASGRPYARRSAPSRPLANLAHLQWLLDSVPLQASSMHTTYEIATRTTAEAPWTYANALPTGGWQRVGGGSLDPATGHWSQGAYNADDIARAAVVFIRHWVSTKDTSSRDHAVELLRTLTFLQDATGPDAGNVVLWMQADGTLTPSAEPRELPDPSDSDESYWLARTVWALGEGYAAFTPVDTGFAGFLRERLQLAIGALERASLGRYGTWLVADDVRVPGWLITGGSDATAEACLGLAAYVGVARTDTRARTALSRYAEGIAAMHSGQVGVWPFGAILPWTGSQSLWHAWGGETGQALCRTAAVLGSSSLRSAGLSDAGSFTPTLLASGGPYNAWSPLPGEAQIAYGAEGRVSSLLAAADLTGSEGFLQLAGLAGGWFFGANPSGAPTYDRVTGATYDGVEFDGRVNRNSGAESTIHGLLAMIALDAHPQAAALAESVTGYRWVGLHHVEAESGVLSGGATVVTPPSAWTGAANWSGGAYVSVPRGGSVRLDVTGNDGAFVHPVVDRRKGQLGTSRYFAVSKRGRRTLLGILDNGGLRETGTVEAEGLLRPFPLGRPLPSGTVAVVVESDGDLQLDCLLIQPAVSTVRYSRGDERPAVLYVNADTKPSMAPAVADGRGWTWSIDGARRGAVHSPTVRVTGAGFAITR